MSFQTSQAGTPTGPLSRSKLAILLDVRFQRRFAPLLVRWLYVGALALIAAVTLFGLLMSWWLASWAGWGFWLGVPISITGGFVWGLGVRLVCEQLIRWTGPEPLFRTSADALGRVIPLAVVPPSGKRARPYGWRWSSPLEERPAPIGPGLLGFAWDVGQGDDPTSTRTTRSVGTKSGPSPEPEAPAGGT